jgi:D-alanine-D-alanine ligase
MMAPNDKMRVIVLTGGTSAEREICLKSGVKVLGALDPERYDAVSVDLASLAGPRAAELHGGAGENGTVQGMLEVLGIPYTGSGVMASALAMNKIMSKKIFERDGIPTPRWMPLRSGDREAAGKALDSIGLPCVVKPACEGSTIGVTVVRQERELPGAVAGALKYGPDIIVERFIDGVEVSGPVLGNERARALPLVEIVPGSGFYDYEAKYTPGATEEIIPARISAAQSERARELTLAAHHALGCRGFSRVDMMVGDDDVYVLEVNSIPGLTDTSLLPRSAEAAGISFPQLVDRIVELALEERGGGGARRNP